MHYSPPNPKGLMGRESAMSAMKDDFMAFPDIQFKIDHIMGEGDWVSVYGVTTGTNTGPFPIRKGKTVKASNKKIRLPQAYFHRLKGGKIIETYEFWNPGLVRAQLGFLRKNVFKAILLIAAGVITMIIDGVSFFRWDPLFPFSGMLVGIVGITSGTHWMAKTLLAFAKTE
jgi:predicted ester cyclase